MTVVCTRTAVRQALYLKMSLMMFIVKMPSYLVKISTLEAEVMAVFEEVDACVKVPVSGGKISLLCL